MAAEAPSKLELHNRAYTTFPDQWKAVWWAVGLLGMVLILAVLLLILFLPSGGDGGAARRVFEKFTLDSWNAFLVVITVVLFILQSAYFWLASRGERLFLDQSEIRYQSPLPPSLQFLQPGWSLRWDQVRRARLRKSWWLAGAAGAELVLTTHAGERRIRPYVWVDPKTMVRETPWQALRRLQALGEAEMVKTITDFALVRFVKARLPQFDLGEAGLFLPRSFALETNRRTWIAVAVLFTLVFYAIVDFMLNQETYVAAPPFAIFPAAGGITTLFVFPWLRQSAVPMAESLVVSLLLGVAFGAALYPGLLRINQITDTDGLQTYRYVLQRDLSLNPEKPGLPALAFPKFPEYWQQFSPGSTHGFRIRRGGLEFYQIDMAPVYAKTREFYRNRR